MSYRLVPAHRSDLVLTQAHPSDEKMDHLGRQRPRRWVRHPPVGLESILHTIPELPLAQLQLIAQNVRPETSPISTAVHRMRDLGPQNPAIRKTKLVREVMGSGTTTRITDPIPALRQTESLVVLTGRLRPAHGPGLTDPGPTSQSRS